jgi:hypothetical protein
MTTGPASRDQIQARREAGQAAGRLGLLYSRADGQQKGQPRDCSWPLTWVELRGFEPLTPSMRTRCATGLRYSPWNAS